MVPDFIDRYQIIELLGEGGMSRVWRAFDPRFEREVAIKVMHGHLMSDPESEKRFTNEARMIAQLEGSAIVPVYDFGRHDDTAFIVMRLMTGGTLQDRIKAGRLGLPIISDVIKRICTALNRSHAKGIIHRDLKPANILFDDDEVSYLSDFGIARMTEGTQTSSIIGTANYMAPEQAQGKPLDSRTDIYQLAVILFEMLTGHQPYEGETTASVLYQHVYEPIPNLIDYDGVVSHQFQTLINTAMAKESSQRPDSASEFQALFDLASRAVESETICDPIGGFDLTRPQPAAETIFDDGALMELNNSSADPTTAPHSSKALTNQPGPLRPRWLGPMLIAVALLTVGLVGAWATGAFNGVVPTDPIPTATQIVVIVTQIVANPSALAVTSIAQATTAPSATPLPTATPSPTLTPPAPTGSPLSALTGGGSGMIAYAASEGNNYDIYIQDLVGGSPVRLTSDIANDFGPVWSPDGRLIAFHTFRDGNWEVYLMDSSGRNFRNLTSSPKDDAFPAWSPDGTLIAYHSNREGDFEIYVTSTDGSGLQQLTNNEVDDFGPSWSPDGRHIVFHRRTSENRQIFLMDRDGSNVRQLTTGPLEHIFPLFSPDGSQILFQTVEDEESSQLSIINADGSGQEQLIIEVTNAYFPRWSPDSQWILFHGQSGSGSNRDIYMIGRDGGVPQRLTSSSTVERMPAWQPVVR